MNITDLSRSLPPFATRGTQDLDGADAMSPSFESNLKPALRYPELSSEESDVEASNTAPSCL